ncbi:MAG: hypothetical protein A4E24_00035 [Methanomethylovorans sp. PtaU1.Bin093]|nr:MAG: hypothetical protein A4E24_00035 [Methanomethylovorans sp. PtaU1.Bin093]
MSRTSAADMVMSFPHSCAATAAIWGADALVPEKIVPKLPAPVTATRSIPARSGFSLVVESGYAMVTGPLDEKNSTLS